MSSNKVILAGGLVLSLAAVLCQSFVIDNTLVLAAGCKLHAQQNNFTFGESSDSDRLVYSDKVSLKSKLWRVNTVDVTYPKQGSPSFGTITKIEVTDLRTDGTGGCVYLIHGGLGQSIVTIHFKTQSNHGLDFLVHIYGH